MKHHHFSIARRRGTLKYTARSAPSGKCLEPQSKAAIILTSTQRSTCHFCYSEQAAQDTIDREALKALPVCSFTNILSHLHPKVEQYKSFLLTFFKYRAISRSSS